MKTNEDYTSAFADLVSEAVAVTTRFCQPGDGKDEEGEGLLAKLRESYGRRIKILNEKDYGRHEVLEKALGQYFGAIVTHLNAVAAKWTALASNGNSPLIDLEDVSVSCATEALDGALKISRAAYAYVAQLERAENELLVRAQLLSRQLDGYMRRRDISYRSSPHSMSSYSVHGIGASVRGHGEIVLSFYYWDGVDEIGATINELFREQDQIAEVRRLADQCFAGHASLGDDLSTIKLLAPVALVKLSDIV